MNFCGINFAELGIYINQVAFILCAGLGGLAHYFKKVARKETEATLTGWFGKDNLAATLYTLLVFLFVIIGALAGDIINSQTGFWACLYTGFATGFAVDSGFNSDKSLTSQIQEVKNETGTLLNKPAHSAEVHAIDRIPNEPDIPVDLVKTRAKLNKPKRVDI